VISTGGGTVNELMALDKSQLFTREDTLRLIAFCSWCSVLWGGLTTGEKLESLYNFSNASNLPALVVSELS